MNGVILIDKPSGKTSYDVVNRFKRVSGINKVGHTGTLDPLATGVLPICINEATKLVQFLIQDHKEYRATMLLGTSTDTFDIEGRITEQSMPDVTEEEVASVMQRLVGTMEQKPPRYSAIKYKGKPMYKWARAGLQLDPPLRTVEIHRIQIVQMNLPYIIFDVSCSKGTYIRSLCHDVGQMLGCPACLAGLRRTRSGHFFENQAITIDGLPSSQLLDIVGKYLIPMNEALPHMPVVVLSSDLANSIKRGYQPHLDELHCDIDLFKLSEGSAVKLITNCGQLLAVAKIPKGWEEGVSSNTSPVIKILRVFNN